MVAEADESDGSFLKLSPVIAVVTNIDREHLDHYGTFEGVLDAFVAFANKVPFYGAVIACADDADAGRRSCRASPAASSPTASTRAADVQAPTTVVLEAFGSDAAASCVAAAATLGTLRAARAGPPQPAERARRGRASASSSGLPLRRASPRRWPSSAAPSAASSCSAKPRGVLGGRRLRPPPDRDRRGRRRRPRRPRRAALVVVFQPHRYTRTARLLRRVRRRAGRRPTWSCCCDIYAGRRGPDSRRRPSRPSPRPSAAGGTGAGRRAARSTTCPPPSPRSPRPATWSSRSAPARSAPSGRRCSPPSRPAPAHAGGAR